MGWTRCRIRCGGDGRARGEVWVIDGVGLYFVGIIYEIGEFVDIFGVARLCVAL